MKICISADDKNIEASVDERFGRCKYFLIIETETMDFDAISNESLMASGGAGIQAAQSVANQNVEFVLTKNIGPNAFRTLEAAGIKVISGIDGNVKDVIEKFKTGNLKETNNPSVNSHFGMNK